ncbi:MAG: hypothetical protein AAFQ51_19000, partial [Pseudomonadota bacterium]
MDAAVRYIRLHELGDAADPARYGERGARLARLAGLGLPVPRGVLLPVDTVAEIAARGAEAVMAEEARAQF